uniref:Uncharacterized protein n=1 Tax=Anabas testudineus TaxID=64144 RepID=A0A3Q1H044_ANATE
MYRFQGTTWLLQTLYFLFESQVWFSSHSLRYKDAFSVTLKVSCHLTGSPVFAPGCPGLPKGPAGPWGPMMPGGPLIPGYPGLPVTPTKPLFPE